MYRQNSLYTTVTTRTGQKEVYSFLSCAISIRSQGQDSEKNHAVALSRYDDKIFLFDDTRKFDITEKSCKEDETGMQIIDLFEVRDLRKRVGSYWTHDESFGYYVTLITYTRNKYDRLIGIDPYVKHESTEIAALRSYTFPPQRTV